jgi:hypothetical protein
LKSDFRRPDGTYGPLYPASDFIEIPEDDSLIGTYGARLDARPWYGPGLYVVPLGKEDALRLRGFGLDLAGLENKFQRKKIAPSAIKTSTRNSSNRQLVTT